MKISITHGFKGLLKPSKEQEELIIKTFGCCRKLWNLRLADIKSEDPQYLTISQYKEAYPYLKEVDSLALVGVERNQNQAFKNLKSNSKHFNFPRFKSKYFSTQSYTTCNQKGTVRFENSFIKLPKLGFIKCKMFNKLPSNYKITFTTVSREGDGKYYVSLIVTYEKEINVSPIDKTTSLGLDYSSPHFYVDSHGNTADYPHFFYKYQDKLAKEQRKLSKMDRGSKNYYMQKTKVQKIHKLISNSRLNFCHQLSHQLTNTYDIIVVEDIDLQNQAQTFNFGKKINDNGFGMFRRFLKYKLEEQGKQLIKIDKWFPSSKTCHCCGCINHNLALNDRNWICPDCDAKLDRDVNAAINILNQGLSLI